jgi:hypothetical protein
MAAMTEKLLKTSPKNSDLDDSLTTLSRHSLRS